MENINSDVMTPEEIYGPEAIDREFALESLIISSLIRYKNAFVYSEIKMLH